MGVSTILYKILCAVSAVLGIIVMIVCAIYLAKVVQISANVPPLSLKSSFTECHKDKSLNPFPTAYECKYFRIRLSAAIIGIICGLIQFFFSLSQLFGQFGGDNGYVGAHIFYAICVLVVAVLVTVDWNNRSTASSSISSDDDRSKQCCGLRINYSSFVTQHQLNGNAWAALNGNYKLSTQIRLDSSTCSNKEMSVFNYYLLTKQYNYCEKQILQVAVNQIYIQNLSFGTSP
ncbi:unnamed protein product [Allacma fusca]|uniref:Uncharacterized protein n=1 Tax=Allacma fusca TaxID=39272 RepID=A0A8J2LN79_9HEXA|nr:unnamed protein product [Allacma fusca]